MAELVAQLCGHLRRGFSLPARNEDGVVAETSIAARRFGDRTFPHSFANERRGVVGTRYVHDHAAIARSPLCSADTTELIEHLAQVRLVARISASISRRVQPGP